MNSCPVCSAENADSSKFCSECGAALSPEYAATVTPETCADAAGGSGSSSISESSHHGRFLPGTKIADRYRIVSLAGKGGMGEVYRADDLKLGHTVALKFLPKDLADDANRLEYFHSEVRLTRQISHPNVCRVYDIGEVDGQHFLSMEYVDGEDLRVLLRRIGRLPRDKGAQIAQQLCTGLAAAHEKSVLHRDLKPANIMLDGRGQVRVTDFGLAKLAEDGKEGEIAGTPRYMAPEQLARGETTIQSDLYSLGLILYELFTGEAVHKSGTVQELLQAHEELSISQPSNVVDDMDPVVERVILRCLEKTPHERPKSAHAVAAALPGGDPLAAALAAGETPSPEMVAAAGDSGLMRPKVALGLFVLTLLCIAWRVTQDFTLSSDSAPRVELPLEPAVLAQRCRDNLEQLGFASPFRDAVFGFLNLEPANGSTMPGSQEDQSSQVRFWYRASQSILRPNHQGVTIVPVWELNPPRTTGMQAGMYLAPDGRLTDFWSVRLIGRADGEVVEIGPVEESTWEELLSLAGADGADLESASPTTVPPVPVDERRAWSGVLSDGVPVRIEAGGYQGRIAWARVDASQDGQQWVEPFDASGFRAEESQAGRILRVVITVLFIAVLILAVLLAMHNVRQGRSNRNGALRTAVLAIVVHELYWLLSISRIPAVWDGLWGDFGLTMGTSLYHGVLIGTLYLALEPFVRRWWPEAMIGWTRLLSGRYNDPIVGRDILIGITAFLVALTITISLDQITSHILDVPPYAAVADPAHLSGIRNTLGIGCRGLYAGSFLSFLLVLLFMVSRAITRRLWPAALLPLIGVAYGAVSRPDSDSWPIAQTVLMTLAGLFWIGIPMLALVRFGALAGAVAFALSMLGFAGPFGERLNDWSNVSYLWVLTGIIVLAAFAFYTSLGGRSVFGAAGDG